MISQEQITRFFTKQCTAEEAEQIAAWLKTHPDIANKYLGETEWQQTSFDENLSKQTYREIWQQIDKKIKRKNNVLLLKRSAAAACIIGCMVVGFLYLSKKEPAITPTAYNKVKTKPVTIIDTEYNYTNQTRRIILPDHSEIALSPQSKVWFDTPFAKVKRDIFLRGEARFEVAKNKQKPFTVYAASFSTTALGTGFIIKQQEKNITVQLLHGKVVIKATDSTIKNWTNVYLLPGQQMSYYEKNAIAKVSLIDNKKTTAARSTSALHTQSETDDNIIFTGSSMTAVLQKLHSYYNVNIQFADSDLKDISFTGVIAKKDSVRNILKVITQMNGLSLEEKDNSFIISKTETNNTQSIDK